MPGASASRRGAAVGIARISVGLIWLAGAAFNAVWTLRQANPYAGIAEESPFPPYRWFFGRLVGAHPRFWTGALILGEVALGGLTLRRGAWGRLGLLCGALFSALLFPLVWPYTLMMGPYAVLLSWLAGRFHGEGQRSLVAEISSTLRGAPFRRDRPFA